MHTLRSMMIGMDIILSIQMVSLRLTESPKFADVIKDEHQRRLLIMQRDYMGEYLNILNQRILLYSYEVQEETSSN